MLVACEPNNLILDEVLALWLYSTNPHAKCLVSALASSTYAALLVIIVGIPVQRLDEQITCNDLSNISPEVASLWLCGSCAAVDM